MKLHKKIALRFSQFAYLFLILTYATNLFAAPPGKAITTETQRTTKSRLKTSTQSTPLHFQVGTASWYGKQFHGRQTASGEYYDMYQLTAAHRTLPLGTWVKVTNVRNGRWIIVRINDRGPVPQDRIIDLSYSAAELLGMEEQGLAKVQIDRIDTPQTGTDTLAESQPVPVQ
jgi:rare lipoprotein A